MNDFGGIQVLCFQSEADGNEIVMETSIVSRNQLGASKHKELKLYDCNVSHPYSLTTTDLNTWQLSNVCLVC